MKHVFLGLGNPGDEYELTRHNTGRLVLDTIAEKHGFSVWEDDKKLQAKVCDGSVGKHDVHFVLPETMMNNSGKTAKKVAPSLKKAKKLVVVYDEIDLPLGSFKISYNRGDAGHNGIKSITRALGTKEYIRIRVGVSPKEKGGDGVRKPEGDDNVLDFLLGKFRRPEKIAIMVLSDEIYKAMQTILDDGHEKAMNDFN